MAKDDLVSVNLNKMRFGNVELGRLIITSSMRIRCVAYVEFSRCESENSEPSWFGYAILVKDNKNFSRDDFVKFLNERRISTRLLFGGNLIKQPAYEGKNYRVVGSLDNADIVMNSTFWIGVYPGITDDMISYISETFEEFFNSF